MQGGFGLVPGQDFGAFHDGQGGEPRLRAHFAEAEVLELMFVIGFQIFASRFANAFRLTPQGFSDRAPRATVAG